jgi:hypothetical protein
MPSVPMNCRPPAAPPTLTRILAVLVVMLCSLPGYAQEGGGGGAPDPAEMLLQQAEKAYEALEYETALKTLIKVHQTKGAQVMQRARSFLYMGVCFTALGNAENAVQSFIELLKLKPSFRLPQGISPSIAAMFKEALVRLKLPETPPPDADKGSPSDSGGGAGGPAGGITVNAKAPRASTVGQALDIQIEITDPQKLVEDVVIQWRLLGGGDFSIIRVKYAPGTAKVTGRIPGAVIGTKATTLFYLVEVLGRGGMTLGHDGTMNIPLEVQLREPKKKKSTWGWWALGIAGGLAIAGGITAAVLLTRPGPTVPPVTTSDVTVTIK